jgi:hypothetical protein
VQDGWSGSHQSFPVVVDPGTMTWYSGSWKFQYGGVGWRPVMGGWNSVGEAGVGAIDPNGVWYPYSWNSPIAPFAYGLGSWVPLAGHWWPVAGATGSARVADGRTLSQPLDESLTSLGEALATPALGTKSSALPSSSASSSATGTAVPVGEQAVRPWSSAQSAGPPAVRHAYLAERVRTAALDELFATGLA